MKKTIVVLAAIVATITSCSVGGNKTTSVDTTTVKDSTVVDSTKTDSVVVDTTTKN